MPAERTLPIATAQREFTVKVNGEPVARENALVALSVAAAPNRIATAALTYADGSAAEGAFRLGDQGPFEPGARLEILAGAANEARTVFDGIVTGQRLRTRENAAPLLVVDCRHAATRMARERRSAAWFDQSDGDVLETLFGNAGIAADVDATGPAHEQLIQHDCTDWDFAVARAAANGLVVLTRGAEVSVKAPVVGGEVAELRYGATLLEFDGEFDARVASAVLQARSWNAADQSVQEVDAEPAAIELPNQLDPAAVAQALGNRDRVLRHGALAQAEAQALADAALLCEKLGLLVGRAKCIGIATILPGDTVRLAGLGERFSGLVPVTGVRHEFDRSQGWKTHLQFGGIEPEPALRERLQPRPAAAMLAPVAGLVTGVVTDNEDPQGEFRVRVRLPLVDDDADGVWARVATLDAGSDRGSFFRPEIGDEVVLGFLGDDPRAPVLLGMLHSSVNAAPLAPANDNALKGFKSRSGIELTFDDDKSVLTLKTPAGNRVVLDDDAGGITIEDANGNRIETRASGVTIESATALTLKIGTGGKVEAAANLEIKAGAALKLEGTAMTDVKSGGVVKVAGSAVQLG